MKNFKSFVIMVVFLTVCLPMAANAKVVICEKYNHGNGNGYGHIYGNGNANGHFKCDNVTLETPTLVVLDPIEDVADVDAPNVSKAFLLIGLIVLALGQLRRNK